jgi:hexosaminidase
MLSLQKKTRSFYLIWFILLVGLLFLYKTIVLSSSSSVTSNTQFANDDVVHLKRGTKNVLRKMQKLVHIDLKGAPPKMSYFKELVAYFKFIGATGLLYVLGINVQLFSSLYFMKGFFFQHKRIEYEDMFPYDGDLKDIANANAYTKSNLDELFKLLEQNDMIVIPLVQTYGHLEFVLKLEKYKYLREVEKHYQVITPCIDDTYTKVLYPMIDQILDSHPKTIKHIHIGCDEVYHVGKNNACEKFKNNVQDYFIK